MPAEHRHPERSHCGDQWPLVGVGYVEGEKPGAGGGPDRLHVAATTPCGTSGSQHSPRHAPPVACRRAGGVSRAAFLPWRCSSSSRGLSRLRRSCRAAARPSRRRNGPSNRRIPPQQSCDAALPPGHRALCPPPVTIDQAEHEPHDRHRRQQCPEHDRRRDEQPEVSFGQLCHDMGRRPYPSHEVTAVDNRRSPMQPRFVALSAAQPAPGLHRRDTVRSAPALSCQRLDQAVVFQPTEAVSCRLELHPGERFDVLGDGVPVLGALGEAGQDQRGRPGERPSPASPSALMAPDLLSMAIYRPA